MHTVSSYTVLFLCCSAVQSGTLLIDSSTIDPSVSQAMAQKAEDKGCTFMDAPVSGGKYHKTISYHVNYFIDHWGV